MLHLHDCLVRFHAEPSGTYTRYQAKAIGSGAEGAQTSLQEQFRKDMTLKEAEVAALSILKQVMEEKVRGEDVGGRGVGEKGGAKQLLND